MCKAKGGNMKKDYMEKHNLKLLSKQRIYFRAFLINFLFVVLVWLMTLCPSLMYLAVRITGISLPYLYVSAISFLAIWMLAGIVFFLVPAVAIWWERKFIK